MQRHQPGTELSWRGVGPDRPSQLVSCNIWSLVRTIEIIFGGGRLLPHMTAPEFKMPCYIFILGETASNARKSCSKWHNITFEYSQRVKIFHRKRIPTLEIPILYYQNSPKNLSKTAAILDSAKSRFLTTPTYSLWNFNLNRVFTRPNTFSDLGVTPLQSFDIFGWYHSKKNTKKWPAQQNSISFHYDYNFIALLYISG